MKRACGERRAASLWSAAACRRFVPLPSWRRHDGSLTKTQLLRRTCVSDRTENERMLKPAAVVVVVSLCLTLSVNAETPPPTPPLALHRAVGAITIDGDLSDPGWRGAATIDRFYETSPGDNIPAKVKTIAHLT